ncbi:MAG: IS1380 family transposase [Planctomycetaceae bacterium]|nr:MAG: IS1380 family transposase [Planctomycetaceae bacterium]
MPQGLLPFKYDVENKTTGMTALAGLPAYLELAHVLRLADAADRHLGIRCGGQGWTDGQLVNALILLNLAGGDRVQDVNKLEADDGFRRIMETCLGQGLPRSERRALQRRWRKERQRVVPSPTPIFRYLNTFHKPEWNERQVQGSSWIPTDIGALAGFAKINATMLAFAQRNAPQETATLDMDATLIETFKRSALYCYKGFKGYQPLNVWWAEQELFVHTEFRAGNVPAGFEQLRVLEQALPLLPAGVQRVRLRSDTAGYQHELLRYCETGANARFGRIEFAIGCPVDASFKRSVSALPESAWKPLHRVEDGRQTATGREWAEVWHVTDGSGASKSAPLYRYLATRERLEEQLALPGVEKSQTYPFPTLEMGGARYKVFGSVSNMDWAGDELLRWLYARCGKSEQAHATLKNELAGGTLPSGLFGANAAWWWLSVLAFNVNAIMKHVVLGGEWKTKKMKAIRFNLINVAGRVLQHARQWLIRLGAGGQALELLLYIRERLASMAPVPI